MHLIAQPKCVSLPPHCTGARPTKSCPPCPRTCASDRDGKVRARGQQEGAQRNEAQPQQETHQTSPSSSLQRFHPSLRRAPPGPSVSYAGVSSSSAKGGVHEDCDRGGKQRAWRRGGETGQRPARALARAQERARMRFSPRPPCSRTTARERREERKAENGVSKQGTQAGEGAAKRSTHDVALVVAAALPARLELSPIDELAAILIRVGRRPNRLRTQVRGERGGGEARASAERGARAHSTHLAGLVLVPDVAIRVGAHLVPASLELAPVDELDLVICVRRDPGTLAVLVLIPARQRRKWRERGVSKRAHSETRRSRSKRRTRRRPRRRCSGASRLSSAARPARPSRRRPAAGQPRRSPRQAQRTTRPARPRGVKRVRWAEVVEHVKVGKASEN